MFLFCFFIFFFCFLVRQSTAETKRLGERKASKRKKTNQRKGCKYFNTAKSERRFQLKASPWSLKMTYRACTLFRHAHFSPESPRKGTRHEEASSLKSSVQSSVQTGQPGQLSLHHQHQHHTAEDAVPALGFAKAVAKWRHWLPCFGAWPRFWYNFSRS